MSRRRISAGHPAVMKSQRSFNLACTKRSSTRGQQAWGRWMARYGLRTHLHDRQGRGFAVVGYGKLGGGGWATVDLEPVFLHGLPAERDDRTGERLRLTASVLPAAWPADHAFCISTRTSSGIPLEGRPAAPFPARRPGCCYTADRVADFSRTRPGGASIPRRWCAPAWSMATRRCRRSLVTPFVAIS
ncbi:hypothetical protein LB464_12705 [Escherichia coli]|nr:hypothetical protein [Escherichia coli]